MKINITIYFVREVFTVSYLMSLTTLDKKGHLLIRAIFTHQKGLIIMKTTFHFLCLVPQEGTSSAGMFYRIQKVLLWL